MLSCYFNRTSCILVHCLTDTFKQRYVEIVILCDLAPPTISECSTTVANTNLVCNSLSDVM